MKVLGIALLGLVWAGSSTDAGAADPPEAQGNVAATIGGAPITVGELDEVVGNRLLALRTEEWNARLRILHDVIGERLVAQEAAARKVTVDELLKAEVSAKTAPVADAEVNATYENVKERFKEKPEAELKQLIVENLRQQREQVRRAEYLRELRDRAGVRVLLDPPRASVSSEGGASKGPKDAPITIVEFSDFQCPYCARVLPAVKKLQETYGDKLRVVFRHYPLPIHPNAPKAAEAAACAQDQGKFWEMHDKLFGNQQKLQVADLKASAAELGLDAQTFAECLDSAKHEALWHADQEQGNAYGVSGTPAFFINGRFLSGAQPYENFAQVVDDELQRRGVAKLK
jgi:protein-disulfide isomerase